MRKLDSKIKSLLTAATFEKIRYINSAVAEDNFKFSALLENPKVSAKVSLIWSLQNKTVLYLLDSIFAKVDLPVARSPIISNNFFIIHLEE
jgi:hypothetical protein